MWSVIAGMMLIPGWGMRHRHRWMAIGLVAIGVALPLAVAAYVVFSDATLRAVAAGRPTSRDALLAISGIGPVKVERFGEAFLSLAPVWGAVVLRRQRAALHRRDEHE